MATNFLEHRFPTIYGKCVESGYRMESDLVPVAPVEHYGIGGVKINLDGETSMPHLYANGECCSSGVHGANRLASNSLLECIVFGKRIAKKINDIEYQGIESWDMEIDVTINKYNYHPIREEIRDTMNKYVFIVRDTEGLHLAQSIINRHYKNLCKHPFTTVDYYRALNIATVAKLITDAAEARKDSIGCHLRIH